MRSFRLVLVLLLLSSVAAGNAWGVVYYTVTNLGTLGGDAAKAFDINESGQVVGYSYNASYARRGFLYQTAPMTDLGTLNGGSTVARGINDSGQIAGSSYDTSLNAYRAYLYNSGTMTNLGTLSGDRDSYGRAINSSGQVVGISRDFSYNAHAFLYSGGSMTNLGTLSGFTQSKAYDINDSAQAVGVSYNVLDAGHAFLYDNGALTDLGTLGGASSIARAINNSGQVVGGAYNVNSVYRAFLYNNGTMSDLGTLGGFASFARDINGSGKVVGTAETAVPGIYHAFVYDNGTMTDLKSVIDPALRWSLRTATAINDFGSIVGYGISPSGYVSAFLMRPILREHPELALPASYTNLRMLQGSTTSTGSSAIGITQPGNTAAGFTLTPSAGLTAAPASGTIAPAVVTPVPFALGWTDTSTTGAQTGSIVLDNTSDPLDPGNHTMSVSGAVVANRTLKVTVLGSSLVPARTMIRAPLTTAISSGNNPAVDGDDVATRVNTDANGRVTDGKATVKYSAAQPGGALLPTFNGLGQSANLAVTFAKTGHYTGSIDLAPPASGVQTAGNKALLADGEAKSVGATVQPATLTYDVDVLEQRKLRITTRKINLGNVLRGANISTQFTVTSTNQNPDSHHATMVNVAPGGRSLGELTAGQTLVAAGGYVNVPLTGTLNTYGKLRVKDLVPVVTAEDASVQDTNAYRDLTVRYAANVGIAKFGRIKTSFTGATLLSAQVSAGLKLASYDPDNPSNSTSLSSKVNPRRTLAADTTPAASLRAKALYGPVGSEATIVDSTPVSADTTVTMQWRARTKGEAHDPKALTLPDPTLPPGVKWLTSDVVEIAKANPDGTLARLPSSLTYALQMTFDNRINLALDGPVNGTVRAELAGLFIGQLDDGNNWQNAATMGTVGDKAKTRVYGSLTDFLNDNKAYTLAQLQGSWGVDPASSDTGTGRSWTIVAGGNSGVFAVVPEPSTWALLLISAVAALLGYGLLRLR